MFMEKLHFWRNSVSERCQPVK